MESYSSMTKGQLSAELSDLYRQYSEYLGKGLSLDMSRGKPCPQQLDLSNGLFDALDDGSYFDANGFDCRNYGQLSGIPDMKNLFSQMLGVNPENIIVGGNSSLNLMFDTFARAYLKGMASSTMPWNQYDSVKFLAPVPGYDRHFAVSEYFGIDLINVPLTENGPDMDIVEKLVKYDDTIKGIWCVPIYSNPDGVVYSAETVTRLASMECAAKDFTIIWDNAYCVHHLTDDYRPDIPNILDECAKYGNDSRPILFASTSKITMSGSGVSCIASNKVNIENILSTLTVATISYDKINQLRHARFLKDMENVEALMKKHASIIKPKFETALNTFERELQQVDGVHWTNPKGGYFISMYTVPGTAKHVHALCKHAGVTLTKAGASYPHGKDPDDSNLRIAPTYPSIEELETACKLLCLCIKIASCEKLLSEE